MRDHAAALGVKNVAELKRGNGRPGRAVAPQPNDGEMLVLQSSGGANNNKHTRTQTPRPPSCPARPACLCARQIPEGLSLEPLIICIFEPVLKPPAAGGSLWLPVCRAL